MAVAAIDVTSSENGYFVKAKSRRVTDENPTSYGQILRRLTDKKCTQNNPFCPSQSQLDNAELYDDGLRTLTTTPYGHFGCCKMV